MIWIRLILVDHILSIVARVHFAIKYQSIETPFVKLVQVQVPHFFSLSPHYTFWQAVIAKIVSVWPLVMWIFMDVFIMVLSIGLSTLFKLFNADLEQIKNKVALKYHYLECIENQYSYVL